MTNATILAPESEKTINNFGIFSSNERENNNINMLKEMSDFVFVSKYARYLETEFRRETYDEAVNRVLKMHLKKYSYLTKEDKDKIKWAFKYVSNKYVGPSMRSMQFGGSAIEAHNEKIYNCAARHIDSIRAFAEVFFVLLNGCGVTVGLSKKYTHRLPKLAQKSDKKASSILTYVIEDTIEGWADSIEILLMSYHKNTPLTGRKIVFDYSKIRSKGTSIKTAGGKAPGHEGLELSHNKIRKLLDKAIEKEKCDRLKTIHIYDIIMHTADAVLSGGVRRAATMAIFDKDDDDMLNAKVDFNVTSYRNFELIDNKYNGFVFVEGDKYEVSLKDYEYKYLVEQNKINWFHVHPQRARSNNSILLVKSNVDYTEFERTVERTKEYGEPGFIFSDTEDTLFNPCAEVGFIPVLEDGRTGVQFCNLTTQNGSKINSLEEWLEAAEAATIIGTLQAGYVDFPYLSDAAKELTVDESLLGVSLTGWFDNPELLLNPKNQFVVASLINRTNEEWAKKLNINPAARTTLVKPEGTGAIVFEASPGVTPHHDHRFFRTIQMNKIDPILIYFKKINPHMVDHSIWSNTQSDDVVVFPIEINKNAIVKNDLSAIEHLTHIRTIQQNYVNTGKTKYNKKQVSHNVSCTVEVDGNEWNDVIRYLYDNRNDFSAVSLVPKSLDTIFEQAPNRRVYETDIEKYNMLLNNFKVPNYKEVIEYEDVTSATDTAACAGGACVNTSIL